MNPMSVPDVKTWTESAGDDTDYLDYLSQHAGLGEWAAFARVFMPRFVEIEGCVLWDRVYKPDNFRIWHKQLRGDTSAIEATLNQLRLWLYIDIPGSRIRGRSTRPCKGDCRVLAPAPERIVPGPRLRR